MKTDGIHIADPQLLTFIAGRISTNIRELEGALTRVVAFASLTGRPMTAELAQDVLKDVFPQGEVAQVTIERIQEVVCERFSMSLEELCSHKRSQNIVYPRQVAMYLSRELTDSSLPKIGKHFGDRDHTTVLHANAKIHEHDSRRRTVYNLVQELTARIKQVQVNLWTRATVPGSPVQNRSFSPARAHSAKRSVFQGEETVSPGSTPPTYYD